MPSLLGAIASGYNASTPPTYSSHSFSASTAAATLTIAQADPTRVAGDLLIASVSLTNAADTVATPSNWTLLGGAPVDTAGGGTNMRAYFFTRVATAGADDLPTWTKTGANGGWRAGIINMGQGLVDVSSTNSVNGTGDTSAIATTITPTVTCTELIIVTDRTGSTSTAIDAGWTQHFGSVTGNPYTSFQTKNAAVAAGATGARTVTLGGNQKWVTAHFCVKHN